MGVVATQGGVVAEMVVCSPGFRVLKLTIKWQWTGAPAGPDALAVQRFGGVPLHGSGGED